MIKIKPHGPHNNLKKNLWDFSKCPVRAHFDKNVPNFIPSSATTQDIIETVNWFQDKCHLQINPL